jgi:adenylate kinase
MNILIMGIRGSGKGTQCKLLAKHLNLPHIATGEICRSIKDKDTPLGRIVKRNYDKGILVPDKIITQLFQEILKEPDCKNGVVVDGYPRNMDQAEIVNEFLRYDQVFSLKVSDKEVLNRLTGRRHCPNPKCEAIYNIYTSPKPKKQGICDLCGTKLVERKDITREVVMKNIKRYHDEYTPLVEYYKKKGILIEINGDQSIESVHQEILKKLRIK